MISYSFFSLFFSPWHIGADEQFSELWWTTRDIFMVSEPHSQVIQHLGHHWLPVINMWLDRQHILYMHLRIYLGTEFCKSYDGKGKQKTYVAADIM